MDPRVDQYLDKAGKWLEIVEELRRITLECGLTEVFKWRSPCYTFKNSNIVIIQVFREYAALMFFKGALLNDTRGIFTRPGEYTQAGRQIRFTGVGEIFTLEPALKSYIYEAIEVEKAGLKVPLKKTEEYRIPEEFQKKLDEIPALKTAFDALTPGRQRAYLLYFSQPKQSTTRESRIAKNMQRILYGKGLNDQ